MTLQKDLRRLSKTTLDAQGAANVWAGTKGMDLVGALNVKAGTKGLELNKVLRVIASGTEDPEVVLSKLTDDTDNEGGYASNYAGGY